MDRRSFVKSLAALGGLAAIKPFSALAGTPLAGSTLGGAATGVARASRLSAGAGLFLAHSDLHNHSLISGDAYGNALAGLAQMRERGIDVACFTEHAISGKGHGELTCTGHEQGGCHMVEGINDSDWELMAQIADEANDPEGGFVSFRAFEWSTPTIGHLNVWFSEKYTDGLRQHAFITPTAAAEADQLLPLPPEIVDQFANAPEIATMRFFWDWLASDPNRELFEGGNDGLACFNHPNEYGTFEDFAYNAAAAPNVVSIEALNSRRDFFWWDADKGVPNPLHACLNAGWRVGMIGVSDEHGTPGGSEYGQAGKARGGLWIPEALGLTRDGVHAAIASRRTFATFEHGLRLDATANGTPMGSALAHDAGGVLFELDLEAPGWAGKELVVETITRGDGSPTMTSFPITVGDPIAWEAEIDRETSPWLFLRITDPSQPADANATGAYIEHGRAVAYASPWFFDPA